MAMIVLLIAALLGWLILVAHGLLELRGWIEAARADIQVQLAHRDRLVKQAADEGALARTDEALAGARHYYESLVAEYNHRLAIPPGPLVGRLARLSPPPTLPARGDVVI